MAKAVVVMYEPVVAQMVSWNGPLGRRMELCAKEVTWRAAAMAPKRTGALSASMGWTRERWTRGIAAQIGSARNYALYMEEGTRPHEIRARNAPMLVFFWPRVGQVVHFLRVNHPGTKPYTFLARALERGVRFHFGGGTRA